MKNELSRKLLECGYRRAEALTKKHAQTFYLASRFLPCASQKAAYTVYAICRIVDDSIDVHTSIANLNLVREQIESAYCDTLFSDEVLAAFHETITAYKIPKLYFDKLIEGMYMDTGKSRYENFDQLYTYCYRVAGVIGLIMLKIFGVQDAKAEKSAVELGIAMQLTNILRDIKEDYARGRIYLPLDEMRRYGVSEQAIAEGKLSDNFRELLKFQIQRTRTYYAGTKDGIHMIANRRCRFVTTIMKNMYAGILDQIEKNNFDVFLRRIFVPFTGKLAIMAQSFLSQDNRR